MAADPSAGRGARRATSGRCCLRAPWRARGIAAAVQLRGSRICKTVREAERWHRSAWRVHHFCTFLDGLSIRAGSSDVGPAGACQGSELALTLMS